MNGARARTDYSPRWKPGPPGRRACLAGDAKESRRAHQTRCHREWDRVRATRRVRRARRRTAAQWRRLGGDWPTYNRDLAGTRYSPLTQINTKNVATLAPAWSYRLRPEPGRVCPRDRQTGQLVRNLSAGHAHRRERRDVSAIGQSRRRARPGDRQRDLALRAAGRTRLVPRPRLLARRRLDSLGAGGLPRASSSRVCES